MDNKDNFNRVLHSFQDEFSHFCRNTISKYSDKLSSELKSYTSSDINALAQIIAKTYGTYIQEQGEKAIEISIYYLNSYKSPPLEKESVAIILDRVRKLLENTAQFARTNMMQKAASKGMENQLILKSYQIEKELEGRINPILETMRIEINKYNISYETSSYNIISNNNMNNSDNIFSNLIERYKILLENATFENRYKGEYQTLKVETETIIENKYGKDSLRNFNGLPKVKAYILGNPINKLNDLEDYKDEIEKIISKLKGYKNLAEQNMKINNIENSHNITNKIFIGHGHSLIWRELKDFIKDKLKLDCEEFNSVSVPGNTVKGRLEEMLNNSCFAFLIMTGEDEQKDNSVRARENVVHEIGLFQGRLGFKKAIILLEDGCDKFSNIDGLIYIPFPKGKIKYTFEDIRGVLERENVL